MQNATSGMIMTYGEDMQVSSTSRGQGCWGSTKTWTMTCFTTNNSIKAALAYSQWFINHMTYDRVFFDQRVLKKIVIFIGKYSNLLKIKINYNI